jgi:hypothetical protein
MRQKQRGRTVDAAAFSMVKAGDFKAAGVYRAGVYR